MEPLATLPNTLLWSILLIAAVTDLWLGLIYNWLTLPAIIAGLLLAIIASGWSGFALALAGILIGGGVFLPGFYFGYLGGGDVKLMAAVGAIAGPFFVLKTIVASIVISGIIAFLLLLYRGGVLQSFKWYFQTIKVFFLRLLYKGSDFAYPASPQVGTFPFGVSILLGAIFVHQVDIVSILYN